MVSSTSWAFDSEAMRARGIGSEALPATRQSTRSTRSSSSNAITYIPKRSRTSCYLSTIIFHTRVPCMECSARWVTHKSHFSNLISSGAVRRWRHQNLENNLSQVQHSEDSTVPTDVLLLAIWTSVLFPFDFLVYISVALVILFFFNDCFVLFCFLINEGSTVIG